MRYGRATELKQNQTQSIQKLHDLGHEFAKS